MNKLILFFNMIIIGSTLSGSLLEHSNISFQKKFERQWKNICTNELEANPLEAAKKLSVTLANKSKSGFFLGLSSSAYQFEGGIGQESSFHRFALKKGLTLPQNACNFWNNYPEMIKQMKDECNINSYRMSISWERIQKTKDSFDYEALDHYKKIIQELKKYAIEPLIVLHHYTIPTWFEDIGGFEKEENINYFVHFATEVYKTLAEEVTYWSTFNAIEGYAFKGYYTLDGAPGIEKNLQKTAEVMLNMLKSHVEIYKQIKGFSLNLEDNTGLWHALQKENPGKKYPEPLIGIQKNVIFLDIAYYTYAQCLKAPITGFLCSMGDTLQNKGFYGFFTHGIFSMYVPFMVSISYKDNNAPHTLDWIGVNTYANQKRYMMETMEDQELLMTTQNKNYRFYPQSVYRAVKEIDKKLLKPRSFKKPLPPLPIWITENGIAAHTDEQRHSFFQQTLLGITKLVEDGHDIIGYTPWASYDNYEWGAKLGEKRYGMFYVDFENPSQKPMLKNGSRYFASFAQSFNPQTKDIHEKKNCHLNPYCNHMPGKPQLPNPHTRIKKSNYLNSTFRFLHWLFKKQD